MIEYYIISGRYMLELVLVCDAFKRMAKLYISLTTGLFTGLAISCLAQTPPILFLVPCALAYFLYKIQHDAKSLFFLSFGLGLFFTAAARLAIASSIFPPFLLNETGDAPPLIRGLDL